MLFQQYGSAVTLSGTTTSSSAAIPADTTAIRVVNAGAVVVFVKTGKDAATAAATSTPIAAGESAMLFKDPTHNYVATITASSTATVYVAAGVAS